MLKRTGYQGNEIFSLNEIPLHTHRMAKKKFDTTKCRQGCGATQTFSYLGLKSVQPLSKTDGV